MYIVLDEQYIQKRIEELEKMNEHYRVDGMTLPAYNQTVGRIAVYKHMLREGFKVHAVDSWKEVSTYMSEEEASYYPNGVIIKPQH